MSSTNNNPQGKPPATCTPEKNTKGKSFERFHGVYLFRAYHSEGKIIGKLEPLSDTVIIAAKPGESEYAKDKPVILRSNKVGKLYKITEKKEAAAASTPPNCMASSSEEHQGLLETTTLFHAHTKKRSIIIPPADAINFLAAAQPNAKSWMEEILSMAATYQPDVEQITLVDVTFNQLSKPKEKGVDSDYNKTYDEAYRKWYEAFKKTPDKKIKAYVIAKVRAIIFSINKNTPIDTTKEIKVQSPKGQPLEFLWQDEQADSNYRLGIIKGSKYKLPEGIYRLTINLRKDDVKGNSKQWNNLIRNGSTDGQNQYSYRLAENVKFGITNAAGEFDIVNCDPISVEETLMVQYPRFYTHLLEAAKSNNDEKSIMGSIDGATTKLSDKTIAPAKGFKDYATSWSVIKQKSQLVAGLAGADAGIGLPIDPGEFTEPPPSSNIDTELNAAGTNIDERNRIIRNNEEEQAHHTNNGINHQRRVDEYQQEHTRKMQQRRSFMWEIGKALHTSLESAEDPKLRSVINSVIATKDGYDAWGAFSDAAKKYDTAVRAGTLQTWGGAVLDSYFRIPPHTADQLAAYDGSLARRVGIPLGALRRFARVGELIDLFSNVAALGTASHTHFTKTLPDLSNSKRDYSLVAKDYFEQLSEHPIKWNANLTNTFELNKAVISVKGLEDINTVALVIIDGLKTDAAQKVSIVGHTCDIGSDKDNLELSERRAIAVRDALITAKVPGDKIVAHGEGEASPAHPNTNESNRKLNRRVNIQSIAVFETAICPSREGIGSLERYRNVTIQRTLGKEDAELAMLLQATDIALGIMSVIPVTAPFAAAIAFMRVGAQAAVSFAAMLDEVAMGNCLAALMQDRKKMHTMSRESRANQSLMWDLFREYKVKADKTKASKSKSIDSDSDTKTSASNTPTPTNGPENELLWALQFRIRSEAVAGLVGLLMRAAIGADGNESYRQRLEKFQVEAYIENFLLNDKWIYPMNYLSQISMDSYWLFAINDVARNYSKINYDAKGANFGLDEKNKLIGDDKRKEITAQAKKICNEKLKKDTLLPSPQATSYSGHMMSYPPQPNIENHITSTYQGYFPIHHLGTEDVEKFGETFNPSFSNYSIRNFAHTAIYIRDPANKKSQWLSIMDPSNTRQIQMGRGNRGSIPKTITPFTPVRILVVFDEGMAAIAPLSFSLLRHDTYFNVKGPVYKELAKELVESELLENEKQYVGRIGCVFYPFFQLWDKTYMGIKPIVGSTILSLYDDAESYQSGGNMDRMEYCISCKIADIPDSEIKIPMSIDGQRSSTTLRSNTLTVDIDPKRNGENGLLIEDFLTSDTSGFNYPKLYDGQMDMRVLVKIGPDSPYILAATKGGDQKYLRAPLFQEEMDQTQVKVGSLKISNKFTALVFDGFDWVTPVEFIVVGHCTKLLKSDYEESKSAVDWRDIGCTISLFEQSPTLFPSEGPTMTSRFNYLGIAESGRGTEIKFSPQKPKDEKDDYEIDPYLQPIMDMLNKKDEKASALLGWEDNDLGVTGKRYVFAAHFYCHYESPKGVKIRSIRPFGKGVFNHSTDFNKYVEVGFGNFKTAGTSNFKISQIQHGTVNYRFDFSAPKSYTMYAPWSSSLPHDKINALEGKLKRGYWEKLKGATISEKDVKTWLEDNSKSLKEMTIKAFN